MSYSSEVLADSPLAYYRLGETSGTSMVDSSGNSRNGTYVNTPTLGATGALYGDANKAMTLTANAGTCGQVASASWMDVSTITVEAWVYLTSTADAANGDAIVSRYNTGGFDWLLWRNPSGVLGVQVVIGGSFINAASSITAVASTWYHLVFTHDGSNVRLFVNGALAATAAAVGSLNTGATPIEIGRYSQSNVTTPGGIVDEVAVYSGVLSSARIAAHYQAGLDPATLPGPSSYATQVIADAPTGYYKLDEISGTTIADSSGNGHSGTYSGATLGTAAIRKAGSFSAKGGTTGQGVGSIPSAAWIGSDNTYSVEFWVKFTNTNDVVGLVSRWNSANGGWIVWQRLGRISFTIINNGGQQDKAGPLFSAGQTAHVVMVQNGSAVFLYVNGVEVVNSTVTGTFSTLNADVQIGGYNGTNLSAATFSDVALYDYALTATQVSGHYAGVAASTGSAAGAFTWAGSATGKKVVAGVAAGAFAFAGVAFGSAPRKGVASGSFTWAGSATGLAPILGPAQGSGAGSFTWAGSATGTRPQSGSASGSLSWAGTATGVAPFLAPKTGSASGAFGWVGTAAGAPAARAGSAAGSFVWAGSAVGSNSAIPMGAAAGAFFWIGLASGANGTTTIPTDPTDIPFGTEDGELDALPALDPTPPGMVQRPLMRRSVIVPRLKDIPGVIIDPETSQPRIPAAVYATFPVIEEEVGVPHVIFPGRDGVHDMTYYRRNRSRIVSTRAEEPFGDTSAQVEFPQITSMDDDPDGLTSPHPWTKIRANMEVVWRKSDGSIRRHWAGNVFSRNVGNDGKSPFLRITALGSLRMAGNAINKPLNRQDPLDLGTIIPRTLNNVVSRRYNAVPHVTTGILSKKRGSWSDSALGFVQDCLADAWTLSGNQWTIAKIPGTRRAYEMRLKKTTPSWTITNGAMGVSVDLNKDGAVRNVIYGHGVRDDGGVWRNTFYFDGTDPNDGVRLPLAADPRTQKRILHPSGLGMMDNPDYDENIQPYEDDVDMGQSSLEVGTYSAQQIVDRESIASLSGRITLRTDPREGSRAFILAGDKIRVLGYEGRDVVLHIAAFEMNFETYEVTLEVSERSHDALTLAQIRSLQKDARRDPAMRPGNPNRRSRLEQDQTPPFDAESRAGIIAPRTAPGGQWSGQAYPFAGAGRIVKTHFEAGSPFAVAIFAKPISAAHLGSIVGNPLTNDNPFEPHLKVLENTYGLVACWGQKGQRMGYSPGREDNGGAFTGNFDEYQTWEYVSGDGVKLWVFVFPQSTTTFSGRCYPGAEL